MALVSDAGMPGISDPGYRLIRRCIERALDVTVLPGPSVVPVALVASGLPTDRWRFEGFLPKRSEAMEQVLRSDVTVVAFESPRRVGESLAALAAIAPDRPAAVCRELTKMHEEISRGSLAELARRFRGDVKGRDRARHRAPPPPRSTTRTSASPSTPSATWSSPAPGRGPRPASSPPSPAPAPTTSTGR